MQGCRTVSKAKPETPRQAKPAQRQGAKAAQAAPVEHDAERAAFLAQVERDGGFTLDCRPEVVFYTDADGEVKVRR
jgi:hypothetical protein